ncbi:hypothetical protein [Nonomuraea rubra]|uniref:hypothetical protein n=1 Tax=Nonomuraea rubra TaxID=46180 RepID=UPI0033C914FD
MLSLTAIEMGLPGFGLEALADVTRGGAWHIGVLAAPGIPELLLAGREREFLGQYAFPSMTAAPGAFTETDIEEFARTYSRPDGWRGAIGLYRSMLREGADIQTLAQERGLKVPVRRRGSLRRDGGPGGAGEGDPRVHRERWGRLRQRKPHRGPCVRTGCPAADRR